MTGVTNERIQPLKEDERLTVDRKSPIFPNQSRLVCMGPTKKVGLDEVLAEAIDQAKLAESLSLSIEQEPSQKMYTSEHHTVSFMPDTTNRTPSPTYPENPKRRYERRNSKTPSMLQASAGPLQYHHRCERRNSAVSSMLFPMSKMSFKDDDTRMVDSSSYKDSPPAKKRPSSDNSSFEVLKSLDATPCDMYSPLSCSEPEPEHKRQRRREHDYSRTPSPIIATVQASD